MKYSMTVAALAAASTLVAAAPASQISKRGSEKFTLPQQSTGKKANKNGPAALASALGKFSKPVPTQVAAAASSASAVATPSENDEEYTVPVQVGGQTLHLDFDTGSSDLWVFTTETKGDTSGHTLYDPTQSGKLQSGSSWKISYGDGSGASGNVYADKVAVGAVTATSQSVEAATSVSSGQGQSGAFVGSDGLLGLASSKINTVKPKPVTTWFDTVKGQLDQALFTATLKHQAPGSYDFGYLDQSKYSGDITYAPVDFSNGFWQFDVDSYDNGQGVDGEGFSAIADTGTTLIVSDNEQLLSDYYGAVDGAQSEQGSYVFPCSSDLPDLTLTIGGAPAVIPGSLINFGPADQSGQTCYGGLQGTGGQQLGFTILGDVFLKAVYAVFDEGNSQFGFAKQA